ncbi:MAG: hypothetical protein FWB82_04210 [Treponema sp.]|nr:hypothetical protein [Treponema sp.]
MATGDLVTWEQVKAVLNLDDDRKELVEFLLSAASAQAEKFAGRFLAARDVSLKMDGRGGRELILPSYPVNNIVRICVDEGRIFPSDNNLLDDQYGTKISAGIIRLYHGQFPNGYDVVLFEGNVGYDPVPNDLQQAVIETISANLRRFAGSGGSIGIKQFTSSGAITAQYEIDVPISSKTIFISYRGGRI